MYTLLNNRAAAKFDLYLPGRLVASLQYTISPQEIMFVYCEAIDPTDADQHCRELMRLAIEDTRNRRIPITVSCPIAWKSIDDDAAHRSGLQALESSFGRKTHQPAPQ